MNTGQISFSTTPEASVARYLKSGSTLVTSVTSMPSSCDARRATASSGVSPGAGWPQNELVQTPGQVFLDRARRVTSTRPRSSTTWQLKARCSGVVVVCTVAFGVLPTGSPASSRRTTIS